MNLVNFIDHTLITEIRRIQQDYEWKHAYLSFGLISQGIEFLGALGDEFDLQMDRPGESKKRFNRGVKQFFNAQYMPFIDDTNDYNLYKNLRCGMLHIVLPKNKLLLGERQRDFGKYTHLKVHKDSANNDRLFLMAEDFYEDFRCACKKAIDVINDKTIFSVFPDLNNASLQKREIINLTRDVLNIDI